MSGAGGRPGMAPARLFPMGMKLSYRLQLNFISSRAILSWCLSLRLIGFEMETPHLSPFPTHGAGALRSGGAEIPLGTSIPACLWVWHSGISAGGGNTGDKGRGKVFPRLVPPVPFGLSGWQRYLPYLPYPPSPALGCRAGLPGGKSKEPGLGRRWWGPVRAPTLLGAQPGAEVPHRGAGAGRMLGRRTGKEKEVGFGREKAGGIPCASPSPILGMGSFFGGGWAKSCLGRAGNSQTFCLALWKWSGSSLAIFF